MKKPRCWSCGFSQPWTQHHIPGKHLRVNMPMVMELREEQRLWNWQLALSGLQPRGCIMTLDETFKPPHDKHLRCVSLISQDRERPFMFENTPPYTPSPYAPLSLPHKQDGSQHSFLFWVQVKTRPCWPPASPRPDTYQSWRAHHSTLSEGHSLWQRRRPPFAFLLLPWTSVLFLPTHQVAYSISKISQ